MNSSPYLSVVVTARNDDHGGNLLQRMQTFVNGLLAQCHRHGLAAELLIVEWNPPADRARLEEALRWPEPGCCEVRIIEVPPEIHRRFVHWRELPLYQMIAKNVGIRRALGEYILATNIDILFSDELMQFIAERKLERGKLYRIDRHDVIADVPVDGSTENRLAYCRSHLIRVNTREGTFRLGPSGDRLLEPLDIVAPDCGLNLTGGWFPPEISVDGLWRWVDNDAEVSIQPSEDPDRMLVLDLEAGPGVHRKSFLLELQDEAGTCISPVHAKLREVVTFPVPASESRVVRVRLHAVGGGNQNFRVRRCELVTASEAPKVVMKLKREGEEARKNLAKISKNEGILSPDVSALWGSGWHLEESLGTDKFRWMDRDSSMVLFLPGGASSWLTLEVESGPALGFQRFQLEVRNQWGEVLAKARVKRRKEVKVRFPAVTGAYVLSLHASGGGPPREVPGDSRCMALRLFRAGWVGSEENIAREPGPVELGSAGSGVWFGDGWISIPRADRAPQPAVFRKAELVVQVPEGPQRTFVLDVEPAESKSAELVVRDSRDRVLFHGPIDRKQNVRLVEPSPCGYSVLRLQVQDIKGENEPQLALSSVSIVHKEVHKEKDNEVVRTYIAASASRPSDFIPANLHTNGCGDFTLMARAHWTGLRGYPEFDMFSMNIDAVLCYAAHHSGAKEEILRDPMRIYHIEHGIGSGWTPEGQKQLFDRIAAKGISCVDYQEVMNWARIMKRVDAPMIFNGGDWGLAQDELTEMFPLAPPPTNFG